VLCALRCAAAPLALLDLSFNAIGDEGADALADALRASRGGGLGALAILALRCCDLRAAAMRRVLRSIAAADGGGGGGGALRACDLSFNAWDEGDGGSGGGGGGALRAIALPASLARVDLSSVVVVGGVVGGAGGAARREGFLRAMGGLVEHARGLLELVLEGNGLGDEDRRWLLDKGAAVPPPLPGGGALEVSV
jgi:hypothetical protein